VVSKISPENEKQNKTKQDKNWKNRPGEVWTNDLSDTSAVLYQLSYRTNWELT